MKSVLSIQSHVAHGYVGGKAAIFPLQCQGWEVDNINTVEFSNHTGYGSFKGGAIDEEVLGTLFNGLKDIGVKYDAVINGYIPNANLISLISENVKKLKADNPHLVFLLDPVMGDQGHLYVDESCVDSYRRVLGDKIVDIITPNQFELELLVGFKINNTNDLKAAVTRLHSKFAIKYVVVTSLDHLENQADDVIYCVISTMFELEPKMELFEIPLIKSYFTGVGDLFTALLLDKVYDNIHGQDPTMNAFSRSVKQVLTIMTRTLQLTHKIGVEQYNKAHGKPNSSGTPDIKINDEAMKYFELKVVQAKRYFSYNEDGIFSSKSI